MFTMEVNGKQTAERRLAGNSLLTRVRVLAKGRETGQWTLARLGGFEVKAEGRHWSAVAGYQLSVWLDRTGHEQELKFEDELTALGLIGRLEYQLDRFEVDLAEHRRRIAEAESRVAGYQKRLGEAFAYQGELNAKQAELDAIEADLAKPSNDNGSAPQSAAA